MTRTPGWNVCAARCHRSLKRDEEITLWRSLCALGAPLYGNLCISFSPFLSFSFSFSLSLFSSFPAPPCPTRAQDSFCHLPLSFDAHPPRRALSSTSSNRILVFLTRSVKHTHHGISPISSFGFSSCLHTLFLPLFSSLDSFFLSLSHSFPICSPLSLPLLPLLVCFPLPVGNCTLSLLPARRFSPARICRCSPIRFRVFCPSPSFFFFYSSNLPSRPVLLYLLTGFAVPSLRSDFSPLRSSHPSAQQPRSQSGVANTEFAVGRLRI